MASPMTGRLAGRGIVLTGATGIAAAAGELFAAEGARVFILSRTEAHCRDLGERIASTVETVDRVAWATADLTVERQVEGGVAEAAEWLGRVDGLFAVAGGSGRRFGDAPVHELTADGWDRTMALNARSQVLTAGAVLRRMLAQAPDRDGARGAICTMSSVLAVAPVPSLFPTPAYAASKGAIATLTLSMASAYATHGIRVNAVAPALTTSRMSERAATDTATLRFARVRQPLAGGFLPPGDVAHAALFFLSPESRYVTGQMLLIDGGWSVTSDNRELSG
jgi:NAD(P)-dependent dehydrogenase (short-subunit alcohol dehydrogenase family)